MSRFHELWKSGSLKLMLPLRGNPKSVKKVTLLTFKVTEEYSVLMFWFGFFFPISGPFSWGEKL